MSHRKRRDRGRNDSSDIDIKTGGGAYVHGNVDAGRDFVGRDKITHIHVTSLSDLDSVDESAKRQLRSLYEERVRGSSERAGDYSALGLFYLDLRQYTLAYTALLQANEKDPFNGDTYYYLALAQIAGQEARTLRWPVVESIENYLQAAIRLGHAKAHYYALWAIFKYEYYLVNGLTPTPPSIDELVDRANEAEASRSEIRYMLEHAPVVDNPILTMLGW